MKNKYTKILKHLKNKTIDEKLKLLEELPTNNTTGLYLDKPGDIVQDPDVPTGITREANFEQDGDGIDGYTGNDTTGLFDDDGTILTIEPDVGDNSYILGPMASMWYAWGNFTQIGYIRQSDRRMVNLGRITGPLGSWDGESNFTSYGQLTLEQAVWFRDTPKLNGADNDTPNYRAFYPGPPSNTPDEYGRYLCVITGTPKPTTATPPPRREPDVMRSSDPTDNFALQLDKKKKQPEIAGVGPYGPGHMPDPIPPANSSPRGPYTPIKDYGTPGNPKFMPSGPSKNPWGVGNKNPKPKKSMVASYEPQGIILSENHKRILRDIRKPVEIKEIPTKFKVKPTVRKNKSVGDKMMKSPEIPAQFKPEPNIWRKSDYHHNARSSQNKKNQVLELVGASEHHWTYLIDDAKKRKQEKINEMMASEFDMQMELLYEKYKNKQNKINKLVKTARKNPK